MNERQRLVLAERNSYSPEYFPGSRGWKINKVARDAVKAYDLAHPEIAAAIAADKASKAAASRAQSIASESSWM